MQYTDYCGIRSFVYRETSLGDVNGDGEITIADVNVIIEAILRGTFSTAADVNNDGEVTIADVNVVINIILSN